MLSVATGLPLLLAATVLLLTRPAALAAKGLETLLSELYQEMIQVESGN